MKFGTRVRLKHSNDRGEFELDRARCKNNIAENSVALGHDTDNRTVIIAALIPVKTVRMMVLKEMDMIRSK